MKRIEKILTKTLGLIGMCLLLGIISAQATSLAITTTADGSYIGAFEEVDLITVSLPTTSIDPNTSVISVPITVGNLTDRNVLAFDFEVRFDPNFLRPIACVPTTNAGTLSSSFVITVNPYIPGRLLVSGYGIYPLSGEGTLLNLNFEVIRGDVQTSPLTWQMFMFNEGDPASIPSGGRLTIRAIVRSPDIPDTLLGSNAKESSPALDKP